MSLIPIPVRVLPTQRSVIQTLTLDGLRLNYRFRHSRLEDRWYMSLLTLASVQLAGTIKMVQGIDLLLPYKHNLEVPKGELFVYSLDRAPPTFDTIDAIVKLWYREAA